VIVIAVSERKH